MFKTILKIAVLSATTITLLSACGAATKALNDAIKDFENRARGNDAGSIQSHHELCLNDPWSWCLYDDKYLDARIKKCEADFSWECEGGGLEFYPVLIKFCNNPANAGHDACRVAPEPQVDSYGKIYNQFLQGTEDGLNTGSLRSISGATAPVVHILKLSDSDNGVAFFAGVESEELSISNSNYGFYVGILPDPDLGAPITQTSGKATWQGTFSVVTYPDIREDIFRTDKDFDLEIDFAENQLSASISNFEGAFDGYVDYRLSGVFSDGKIEGEIYATYFPSEGSNWVARARVQGLIGQDGAIGAFVPRGWGLYAGGFVARPPSK